MAKEHRNASVEKVLTRVSLLMCPAFLTLKEFGLQLLFHLLGCFFF